MSDQPERITRVALRHGTAIFTAVDLRVRHGQLFRLLSEVGVRVPDADQGFLTDTGRFVDRVEGLAIATEAGQIVHKHGQPGELYSEDLW